MVSQSGVIHALGELDARLQKVDRVSLAGPLFLTTEQSASELTANVATMMKVTVQDFAEHGVVPRSMYALMEALVACRRLSDVVWFARLAGDIQKIARIKQLLDLTMELSQDQPETETTLAYQDILPKIRAINAFKNPDRAIADHFGADVASTIQKFAKEIIDAGRGGRPGGSTIHAVIRRSRQGQVRAAHG